MWGDRVTGWSCYSMVNCWLTGRRLPTLLYLIAFLPIELNWNSGILSTISRLVFLLV